MSLSIFWKDTLRIPHLAAFLPEFDSIIYRGRAQSVAGWGRKRTSWLPRLAAKYWKAKYISLEDGFLRSYGLGKQGATPLSLIVDEVGIYYDATQPSKLEMLIQTPALPGDLQRAEALIREITHHKLTKYNTGRDDFIPTSGRYVLVVDQTRGDASIEYGMADADSFKRMLQAARAENPGATILLKTHPDVVVGKSRGYLSLNNENIQVIAEDINPFALFPHLEKLYTVTSLIGMEALMAGVPVRCFGMPFYAGWGLTQDEFPCQRRSKEISLPQLVAAAYLHYPRYVNPYTGRQCTAEEAVEILRFIKAYYQRHSRDYYCVGFSRWKQYFTTPYLHSAHNKLRYVKRGAAAIAATKKNNTTLAIWAAKEKPGEFDGLSVTRVEDGFLRSVGFGSDFIPAQSLVIDDIGIHFNYQQESGLERILNHHGFAEALLARARALRDIITRHSLSKYNTESAAAKLPPFPADKKIIMVVGQVENDASIRLGCPGIKTNAELIRAVRARAPEAYLVYKPHPEVVAGNRRGVIHEKNADCVVTDIPIHRLIASVEEVHVLTSLVGFEALLQQKKVVVHGLPFYAGWGLTQDIHSIERRKRMLTLDELVAGALILYPSYFDFDAKYPATPEVIVAKLLEAVKNASGMKRKNPLVRRLANGMTGIKKSLGTG